MHVNITSEKAPYSAWCFRFFSFFAFCLSAATSFAQNTCGTALPIGPGTYTISVIDGTNITVPGCSTSTMAEWYVYTPTENHSVTVTSDLAANICKDTHFAVYTGSCSGLQCFTSDDDSGVIQCNNGNSSSYLSTKTFDAMAGTTYYIAWTNRWQTTGFDFQLIENPYIENPCNTATTVTAGVTTVSAVDVPNIATTCSIGDMARWYKYIPSQDYHLTITSDLPQNLCNDTFFSVYTGSCTALNCMVSDDNGGDLVCTNDGQSNLSTRTFDVVGGTTYYIVWDNRYDSDGFDFEIIEEEFSFPVNYTTQTIPNMTSSYNTCIVDMDGDGRDDIAGVSNGSLRIHFQQSDASFSYTDFPVGGFSYMPTWSIAAADYNKDGFTDLLLGSGQGLSFWKSNSTGSAYENVTPGDYIFCQRTNFVDIDNDGNLDAFSCHDIAPNCYYINDGNGNMTFYQSNASGLFGSGGGNYASIWTDYNNDGHIDLFVSKCSGPPCELRRNNGNGTFTEVASVSGLNFQPVSSWSSAVADFDNDGDMDILVGSNGSADSRLFVNQFNDGTGAPDAFTDLTLGSGWDLDTSTNRDYIAYDFDNDGNVDVLAGGSKIMFGQGDGTFVATPYPGGISVGAVGDLNSDGFLDLIDWNNNVRMAVPNGNNWTVVRLQGIQSNAHGIGARVEIYGPWGKQIRDVRSGEGFEYMSTLNAHFGIGQAETIDSVVIRWPSGVVDVIENPDINELLTIVEGSSPLSTNSHGQAAFGVYPVPARELLNVAYSGESFTIRTVEIFDLSGRLVSNPELKNDQISVSMLSNGTYILVLRGDNGVSSAIKFIKE